MITDTEDLLLEILLWLPAKSLIRFKLVCKRWFSIISDHNFSRRHTLHHHHRRRSKSEYSLLLRLEETSEYFYLQTKLQGQKLVKYHFSPNPIEPNIWSFSNGLFLLVDSSINDPLEHCHIYNPTTKQSKMISLNPNDRFTFVVGLNLAFDPLKSPHYHIVCVRATRRRRPPSFLRGWYRFVQIEAYESGTDTWRLCGETFMVPRDVDFNHGVYWKGGIHWGGIYFDLLEGSVWKHPELVELPENTGRDNFYGNYVESGGYLHYIGHFVKENLVMVFELQSDFSQWLLKHRINLDICCEQLSVLSIIRGLCEEDSMLVLHEPGKVMAYDIREKSVNELIDFRDEAFYKELSIQFASRCACQFIETLAVV